MGTLATYTYTMWPPVRVCVCYCKLSCGANQARFLRIHSRQRRRCEAMINPTDVLG